MRQQGPSRATDSPFAPTPPSSSSGESRNRRAGWRRRRGSLPGRSGAALSSTCRRTETKSVHSHGNSKRKLSLTLLRFGEGWIVIRVPMLLTGTKRPERHSRHVAAHGAELTGASQGRGDARDRRSVRLHVDADEGTTAGDERHIVAEILDRLRHFHSRDADVRRDNGRRRHEHDTRGQRDASGCARLVGWRWRCCSPCRSPNVLNEDVATYTGCRWRRPPRSPDSTPQGMVASQGAVCGSRTDTSLENQFDMYTAGAGQGRPRRQTCIRSRPPIDATTALQVGVEHQKAKPSKSVTYTRVPAGLMASSRGARKTPVTPLTVATTVLAGGVVSRRRCWSRMSPDEPPGCRQC